MQATRHTLAATIASAIVLASIVVSCADGVAPTGVNELGNDQSTVAASMQGGGWTPAIAQASKIDICHSGNGKHFTAINVSSNAAKAHLCDPTTGMGGHDADYRISDLTPCPPPVEPGIVQVCKIAGNGVAAGTSSTFTVVANGLTRTVTVPAGNGTGPCVEGGAFRVGTDVTITEASQQNVNVTALTVSPAGAQVGVSDLNARRAMLVVGIGTTSVTYTNTSTVAGSMVICKVAGTGVTAGTNFTFSVAGQTTTVAAGAAPAGTCSAPIVATAGDVVVTEQAATGFAVSGVTATGAGGSNVLVSSDNATGTATATVGAGQLVTVTYTNVSVPTGTLVICKIAGTGVTAGTNFTFTVAGQSVTVAAGATPGTCSAAITLAAGAQTVTETAVAGTSVSAITGTPQPTNINLQGRSATSLITAGQESRITFTNTMP